MKTIRRLKNTPPVDVENLTRFRSEVIGLYKKFENDLVSVSKKFGLEVNMWYSPSKIPQPNFKVGRMALDMDRLYNEQDFKELVSQNYPLWSLSHFQNNTEDEKEQSKVLGKANDADLLKRNVAFRQQKLDLSNNTTLFDFRQSNADMRLKRLKSGRGFAR